MKMASTDSTSSQSANSENQSSKSPDQGNKNSDESKFECNICFDVAKDAVVSYCGHLFCWPCLHQWLETRPNRQSCPVCKASISRDKVIPLYGRNGSGEDPRSKVPPRPQPSRTEPQDNNTRFSFGNNDGTGGFQMSFGIGAFPFGFFASAVNWGTIGNQNQNLQNEQQEQFSKMFLGIALIMCFWLIIA